MSLFDLGGQWFGSAPTRGGSFSEAIEVVLRHEGGYVNDPNDPGGETNFGLSKRSYPNLQIAALTRDQAMAIYKQDFWNPFPYENIPSSVATKLFDLAVNMGSLQAFKLLQRAVRAVSGHPLLEDGRLGPTSLEAIRQCAEPCLLAALKSEAAGFYRGLKNPHFEDGWLNRAYS